MRIFHVLLYPFLFFFPGLGNIPNPHLIVEDGAMQSDKSKRNQHSLKGLTTRNNNSFGFLHAVSLVNTISLIVTLSFIYILIAFIEPSDDFVCKFGYRGLAELLGLDFINLNSNAQLMQQVLAKVILTSVISYIQLLLILTLVFLFVRVVLFTLGVIVAGKSMRSKFKLSENYFGLCITLLPALGMLSTILGILSQDTIPNRDAIYLIFGPSGVGIIGFLLANLAQAFASYLNDTGKK